MGNKNIIVAAAVAVAVVFLASSLGLLGSTGYVSYMDTLRGAAQTASPAAPLASTQYRVVVLSDGSCSGCDSGEIVGYLSEVFPGLKVGYVDIGSLTGQKLVGKYGLSTVPAYVLNLDVESSPNFALVSNAMSKVADGYVLNLDDGYVGRRI